MKTILLPFRFALILLVLLLLPGRDAAALSATPGDAVSLDGSTGFVYSGESFTVFTATQPFTISIWFNTTTANGGRLIGYGNTQSSLSTGYDRHLYMDASGHLYFGTFDGSFQVISDPTPLNDGNWHQAVGTFSTTAGMCLYVDGVPVASNASFNLDQTFAGGTGYWRVGWDNLSGWPNAPANYYFQGKIDEAQVWDIALTSSQVQSNLHQFQNGPLEVNLVTYWQFDTGSGSIVTDSSVFGNAGFLQGGVTWVTSMAPVGAPVVTTGAVASATTNSVLLTESIMGNYQPTLAWFKYGPSTNYGSNTMVLPVAGALHFDGTGNNFVTMSTPAVPTRNPAYTIEGWFKANTMGNEGIVGWGNWGTGNAVISLRLDANGIRNDWWNNDLTQSVNSPTNLTGAWHHAAATYDGTNRTIYLDGTQVGQDEPSSGSHDVPDSGLELGNTAGQNGAGAQSFNGLIGEVRIWNTALSQSTIQSWMFQTVTVSHPNYANLTAYWPMTNAQGTNVTDVSGHGNNGEFVGSPVWTNGAFLTSDILSATISGLPYGATIHFQAVATNTAGLTTGQDMAYALPLVVNDPAVVGASDGAVLKAMVNSGGLAAIVYFQYGTSTNFGSYSATNTLAAGDATDSVSIAITNLLPGATYYYSVVESNANGVFSNAPLSFVVLGPPAVVTQAASSVTTNSALLGASINPDGYASGYYFSYGLSTSYGLTTPTVPINGTNIAVALFSQAVSGLLPGVIYHYQVVGTNSGGTGFGADMTFTTAPVAPSVTTLTSLYITTNSALLTASVAANDTQASVSFNYGTNTNYGIVSSTGVAHGALSFNGSSNNYVSVPNPSVPAYPNSYSIEAWFYATGNQTDEGIVGWGNWGTGSQVAALRLDANGVRFEWGNNDLTQSVNAPTNLTGVWHHAAATWLINTETRTLYLDGVQVAQSSGFNNGISSQNLQIGMTGGPNGTITQPFNGLIKEVRIWNTALSQQTIQSWMFQGINSNHPNYGNLVGYWPMNGIQGTSTNVPDLSGHGNHGVFVGSPVWTSGQVLSNEIVGINVTGLTNNTVYHFQAAATNSVGPATGQDEIFGTLGVTTEAATDLTTNSASLNATVDPGDVSAAVYFEYGLDTTYGSYSVTNTVGGESGPVAVSIPISSLLPGLTYYFNVVASSSQGVFTGQPMSFTTPDAPPAAFTQAASSITAQSAVLNALVASSGLPTAVYFTYGLTATYGSFSATNYLPGDFVSDSVAIAISNLASGTLYYFQAVVTNVAGGATGGNQTLQTFAPPTAVTGTATRVLEGGANLSGTINPGGKNAATWFEYGLTPALGSSTPAIPFSNYALFCDGTGNNFVNVLNSSVPANASPYTIEAWFLANSMGDEGIVGWGNWGYQDQVNSLRLDANGIRNDWWSDDLTQSVNSPTNLAGAWHHAAATYDGTNRTIYLDGEQVGQDQPSDTHMVPNSLLEIGLTGLPGESAQPFNGSIDEVRIWNTNLSQTTLQNWMFQSLNTNHPNWSNLAAYWTFDDVTGAVVPDDSGNGNTGTMGGQPLLTNGAPLTNKVISLVAITGLLPDMEYYYELFTSNIFGQSGGGEETFTTAPATPPVAMTLSAGPTLLASPGVDGGVLLSGTVQAYGLQTTLYFEYGATTNYGSVTAATSQASNGIINFSQTVANLIGGDAYHYQIVATNAGGVAFGGDQILIVPAFSQIINAGFPQMDWGAVAWGDFNGDGKMDILLSGQDNEQNLYAQVWENLGHGDFSNINVPLPGLYRSAAAWGDFDNDGHLDILLMGRDNFADHYTEVWRNLGGGAFANLNVGLPGLSEGAVAVADFDNDGRLDFVLTGQDENNNYQTQLWRNMGNGAFSQIASSMPGVWSGSVAWGDYDNDGKPDLLLTGGTVMDGFGNPANGIAQLWHNLGGGNFQLVNIGLPGCFYSSVAWGDYNNDGFLDILLSGTDGTNLFTQLWRNNGNGTFTKINAGLPADIGLVAWGDYNNDGKLDILTINSSGAQIWQNMGNGTFSNINAALPNINASSVSSLAWGDFDNDGRLDVLLSGYVNNGDYISDYITAVFRNDTLTANTPPSPPMDLSATNINSKITLKWNAASDAQTPASGLSYNLRIGTTPGGQDYLSPEALPNGRRLVPALGNVGEILTETNYTPVAPGVYYWSVQAVDTAFAGSPFAPETTFGIAGVAPVVNTLASIPGRTSATISALVNPVVESTSVQFLWGTTMAYGNVTTEQNIGNGGIFVPVNGVLSGLTPNTTYHWRAEANNSSGTTLSPDQTFTTDFPILISVLSVGQGSNGFQIEFEGDAGASYHLQSATNLNNPNWVNVSNIVAGSDGVAEFTGLYTTNGPHEFYRLSSP